MSASVSDIYGSAHDPLCFVNNLCVECHCDLIARVREDERVERREALKALIEDAESNDLYAKTDRPAPKTR